MQAIDQFKAWLMPLLLTACTYLLWDKLDGMEARITKLESVTTQVTINTTDISYLKQEQGEMAKKLDIHLAAILPDETAIKQKKNF
jgi:hypothetical protein